MYNMQINATICNTTTSNATLAHAYDSHLL